MAATLECPGCGHEESPLRHTFDSNCGGAIGWEGGKLRCQRYGMHIYKFRCNNCGRRLDEDHVS